MAILAACSPNPNGGGVTDTGTISGRVLDATTGQPISNAFVSVSSLINRTLVPSDQGGFVLTGVPIGQQTLTVSAIGYLNDVETITVQKDQTSQAGAGGIIRLNSTLGPIPGPSPAPSP
jgi:hypothetical protein